MRTPRRPRQDDNVLTALAAQRADLIERLRNMKPDDPRYLHAKDELRHYDNQLERYQAQHEDRA